MGQRVHVLKNIFIKVTQAHWGKQNRATPLKTSMSSSLELGLCSLPLPGHRNFAGVMNEDKCSCTRESVLDYLGGSSIITKVVAKWGEKIVPEGAEMLGAEFREM